MLTTLTQATIEADGQFLGDRELQALERYVQTFNWRQQVYEILSEKANELVIRALKRLAQTHRREVETYSAKCKRDMDYAVRYIARAVLLDESETFHEDFALWMKNITRAVHKGNAAAKAYECLKVEVQRAMPAECAALVTPYVDDLIAGFSRV